MGRNEVPTGEAQEFRKELEDDIKGPFISGDKLFEELKILEDKIKSTNS